MQHVKIGKACVSETAVPDAIFRCSPTGIFFE
jgi:hypothetical protein